MPWLHSCLCLLVIRDVEVADDILAEEEEADDLLEGGWLPFGVDAFNFGSACF